MNAAEELPPPVRALLHERVRSRRIRDLTYVLGPDGVTCVALDDERLAALAAGDTEAIDELRRAGFTPEAEVVPGPRFAVTRDGLEMGGLDRLVDAFVVVARRGAARRWAIALPVIAIVAVVWSLRLPTDSTTESVVAGALLLILLDNALLVVHELGHGIVLHWHGERIGRAGFGLHWGMPCFYVDATAALMLPKRARAWQAAAGVIAEGVAVTGLAIVAAVTGSDGAAVVAGQAGVLVVSSLLINLVPALDLDGAWLLADLADRPQLIHGGTGGWVRAYRALNGGVGLVTLGLSVALWASLWTDLVRPLWAEGALGIAVLAVAMVPMVAGVVVNTIIVISRRSTSPPAGATSISLDVARHR